MTLAGWTPTEVRAGPVIRWCFTDGLDFTDPFFDESIERSLRDPFRLLFWRETDMAALAQFAAESPGLAPAGFIFHSSRCGSTLLTQMLAGLASTLVMSEPGPIDAVLRLEGSAADRVDWVRWVVSALGQPRRPSQTGFVVKFDAWSILQLPVILRAFPDTPCVFVYRDPVEVVSSQLGRRGYHMIPGTLPPEWFGMSPSEVTSVRPEEYCAAVLRRLCEVAVESGLRVVNYRDLPGAVTETIAPLFGIDPDPAVFTRVAGRDAKNPFVPFVATPRPLAPAARAMVEARVGPAYEALERVRLGQS